MRKPKDLIWFGTRLGVSKRIGIMALTLGPIGNSHIAPIPIPAAKKLYQWLERATKYLEDKKK